MLLTVHAKPGAKQNKLEWMDQDTLKISVTARAEQGKANAAILELLAEELNVPKTSLQIVRGATTRLKQISFEK
jgi:hypothetical protein